MARKGKDTPMIRAEITKLLSGGCLVVDVCSKVGIAQSTYFDWIAKKPEFSEAVDRAKAEANVGATLSLRKAMMPHDVTSKTIKVLKETRLRKVKGEHGISEQPYEYVKTEQSETVTNEFDWRAALEFLKRRDPDNWSEKLILKVEPEWLVILDKFGLTPGEAMEKFVQRLSRETSEVNNAT